MKYIYNEGRVVGLSSYELYIRELLSTNPDAVPLSERAWLASTVSANNSMILKIKAGTEAGYHDYMLPEHTDLCACTVVYGSIFEGTVSMDEDDMWGVEVGDYGPLIKNEYGPGKHPVSPGLPENVPTKSDPTQHSEIFIKQCHEYIKIVSGLVLQPGDWIDNVTYSPILTEDDDYVFTQDYEVLMANIPFAGLAGAAALVPDLSKRGFVRLSFSQDIDHDFYLLLYGFTMKTVMKGVDGFKNSFISTEPWNGDYLGPQIYPWATKIVFQIDNDTFSAGLQDVYNEIDLRFDSDAQSVFDALDFNSYNKSGFYHIDDLSVYSNGPTGVSATSGQLFVSSNGDDTSQIYVGTDNSAALRFISGSTAYPWIPLGQNLTEKIIGPTETTPFASRTYVKGEYLVFENTFCLATAKIYERDRIVFGVNVRPITISQVLYNIQFS